MREGTLSFSAAERPCNAHCPCLTDPLRTKLKLCKGKAWAQRSLWRLEAPVPPVQTSTGISQLSLCTLPSPLSWGPRGGGALMRTGATQLLCPYHMEGSPLLPAPATLSSPSPIIPFCLLLLTKHLPS